MMNFLRMLPLVTMLMASGAPAQASSPPSDAPVRIGTFRGVERFEDPGHDVPGFHVVQRYRRGLLIGGGAMFAVAYLFSLVSVLLTRDATDGVPFAGAFMSAAKYFDSTSAVGGFGGAPLLGITAVVSGAAQLVGVAMVMIGLTVPNVWLERDDAPNVSLVISLAGAQLRVAY